MKPYESQGNLDIKKHLNDVVGVSVPNQDKLTILVKVHGSRRHYVDTKKIHRSQKTIEMTTDVGLFSIAVIPNNELYAKLLSFGGDLEVISPDEVRSRMKEKVVALYNRY